MLKGLRYLGMHIPTLIARFFKLLDVSKVPLLKMIFQVPPIQGAMLHWVCNLHDHPIPLGPPGHYVINDNGMVLVSEPGGLYPPGPPPYTNGTTPPWSNQVS